MTTTDFSKIMITMYRAHCPTQAPHCRGSPAGRGDTLSHAAQAQGSELGDTLPHCPSSCEPSRPLL